MSEAAISAREVLRELARRGWRVRVLCCSFFDDATADENSFYATLKRCDIAPSVERKRAVLAGRSVDFRLVRFLDDGIEATVFSRTTPRRIVGVMSRVLSWETRRPRSREVGRRLSKVNNGGVCGVV